MKRTLLLILAFLPMLASADAIEIDGIYYNLNSEAKTAEVTSNPNKYQGDVAISESVTYDDAVYSVTTIGWLAFAGCSGLTSITIPDGVASIGEGAFYFCSGLTSITIPSSVTRIDNYAFDGCSGLTSINIPNSVTTISNGAFNSCSSLTSVTIPNSVTRIGSGAFSLCSSLTSIKVESENTKYDSRDNCNAIIETESNTLISGCQNTTIPSNVTSIGEWAFSGCSGSITIPSSVTSIGNYAFSGSSGLTAVIIPNSVTSIGEYAFQNCSGLTSITIPSSVTSIGEGAFRGCCGLTSISIPGSVTSIDDYVFYECSGLTSVSIPNSATSIGRYAFNNCSGLTSVTIPNSVTLIEQGAFFGCNGLTSITIGSGTRSIGNQVFARCSELTDVYCYAESVPYAYADSYSNAFKDSPIEYATLHVPAGSVSAYLTARPWKNFKEIVALPDQGDETDDSDYIPFVESGKIWHVASSVPDDTPNYSLTTYQMNEEEEHDGKTYFRIQYFYKDAYNEAYSDVYKYQLVREENRRVYIYYEWAKKEIMLYDFTLKEGDTFYYEFNRQNCKVLKQGWLEDGPQIVSSCTLNSDNTWDIKYRRLRTWTIGRETGSGQYHEFLTWVEGVGTLDNMFCSDCNGTIPCLAYVERKDNETDFVLFVSNEYLPFSFYNTMGLIHGCDLPTGAKDNEGSDDSHHHLTYEMEGDRLHVYGKVITQCGPNNYAYFIEKETDDPSVHKIEFEIEEVEPTMDCTALHATDFYVSGFDPNLNYIVVDNNGEEHPVINKTQQMAYRPFIEEGKVWKVGYGSDNPIQFVEYYYFDSDTIIDGKVCKQMMCQRYVTPDYADYKVVMQYPLLRRSGVWYEEDKKVYVYDDTNKQFILWYDFSLNANDTFMMYEDSYVVGPRQTGGLNGFKGVYRDIIMSGEDIYNITWLEGVGSIEGPKFNVYHGEEYHGGAFLMSCTVGDEVIYLNDEYEDGATPAEARKRRIDFTHTIKIQPKARIKQEESDACINSSERDMVRPKVKALMRNGTEESMYGEYNDLQLCINLDPLDDAYQVRITSESGKAVYEKDINAGNIVGLNIDISTYAKGHYTVTLENSGESFTGEFGAGNADANGDGGVNVADVDFVIEHIGEALDAKNKAVDVNSDGEINVADVDYIIERIK